jgi:protein TonB
MASAADPVSPIVRVGGMRQELPPAGTASPDANPKSEPTSDGATLPPPPRAQSLADTPPRPVHCPMPSAFAPLHSPNAMVRLRLNVDEDGDVTEATILISSGSRELDDAALDVIRYWEYAPATRNGRNIPGAVIETIKFSRRE